MIILAPADISSAFMFGWQASLSAIIARPFELKRAISGVTVLHDMSVVQILLVYRIVLEFLQTSLLHSVLLLRFSPILSSLFELMQHQRHIRCDSSVERCILQYVLLAKITLVYQFVLENLQTFFRVRTASRSPSCFV